MRICFTPKWLSMADTEAAWAWQQDLKKLLKFHLTGVDAAHLLKSHTGCKFAHFYNKDGVRKPYQNENYNPNYTISLCCPETIPWS